MSFFRYPGGKKKLREPILNALMSECYRFGFPLGEYREPFFGGGSIGLLFMQKMLNTISSIWVNDKDYPLACLWTSVISNSEELLKMIQEFIPTADAFFSFKDLLEDETGLKEYTSDFVGFMKLAIHQISYSGLGTKAGGPIGGKAQNSQYDVGCRWTASTLLKNVHKFHHLFSQFEVIGQQCTTLDFEKLLTEDYGRAVIFLDPPYFVKGNELYPQGFSLQDHERLTTCLRTSRHAWVLTYDDCPEIRTLYAWARIEEINVTYSINGIVEKKELLITQD